MSRPDEARVVAAKQDISAIMRPQAHKLDNRRYPSAEQGLQAWSPSPAAAPVPDNWKSHLDSCPVDPGASPTSTSRPASRARWT